MGKIKNIMLIFKQLFSQMMCFVLGRDESNDEQLSTQHNRYYT